MKRREEVDGVHYVLRAMCVTGKEDEGKGDQDEGRPVALMMHHPRSA